MQFSDILVLIGLGAVIWLLLTRDKAKEGDTQSALLLQNQMKEINRTVQKQYEESMKIVKDSVRGLTKMEESQKQVADVGKQIEGLQNILKNPKQRGVLGEYRLETLLKNVFSPKEYKMQYGFKNGDIVDAVIFVGDKIIPVDSKFSLENYNRIVDEVDSDKREELEKVFKQDLKNRIDETAKYIRPEENTTEYAFMFIPAEAIFYDLLNNEVGAIKSSTRDLIEYAINDKKVYITSPTTFYAYLQAMLQSARDYRIQESTKEILKNVSMLGRHLEAYHEHYQKVGNHLGTVVNAYNRSAKEFGKIDKDITKLTGENIDAEIPLLDKPLMDEE
ncbi:MAG: DNA recombination protein RmuC [Candidatus Colwellbacteria bacterium CG10_big_fil_rev_8_21_14_0_10_42_22]|uniref:DNA recombination protein RmuC n=1 Tax=Candidatus Colwellbacteria bacterium CG10_big_fil_rev_8_21_14_0_10_42_22 TaxID=1974540 RepID=A0A2H0VGC1_9BACT|nr:MAG: DNA recombination protein RmuC [Candidatus Colwellbacteria bacterium CG10_big_fil_rev_8_21_14_0_10_42_22]